MRRRLTLATLVSLITSACASAGAVPRPFPMPGAEDNASTRTVDEPRRDSRASDPAVSSGSLAAGYSISTTALALRGTPYRNGGADPSGFDCSGLVQYVFEQHGIAMPRDARRQFEIGRSIEPASLLPGDLVFFTTVAPGASHVGIAVGGDQFVHAPTSNGVVRVEQLSAPYWSSRFVGAKRPF
jgi:cell wall-associated NlpC family hydrolase